MLVESSQYNAGPVALIHYSLLGVEELNQNCRVPEIAVFRQLHMPAHVMTLMGLCKASIEDLPVPKGSLTSYCSLLLL